MAKRRRHETWAPRGLFWGHWNEKDRLEHYYYPSQQALRLFYHIRSVGRARVREGFRFRHANEKGFLFHFSLRGELWHRLRDRDHTLREAEGCLLDMAEPVEYGCHGKSGATFYWMVFDGPLMPNVFRELNADIEPLFTGLDRDACAVVCQELIRLVRRQRSSDEPDISTLLAALLAELFRCRPATLWILDAKVDPASLSVPTRQAIAFIARFHTDPLQIKHLASTVHMGTAHFCRVFRRETGLTPHDYLTRYRMELAKSLLRTTDKPLQQIGRMVGIANPDHFSTTFRQTTGLSPRAFREQANRPTGSTAVKPQRR